MGGFIAKDAALYARCEAAKKRFIQDWELLVNTDSPTGYGEGLIKVGNIVIDQLKAMGAEVATFPTGEGQGFHLTGTVKGEGQGKILLLAHMDTVLPVGSAAKRPFRIDAEGKAYGPGVLDCRSGLLISLNAMQIVKEHAADRFGRVTLFSNCDEEDDSVTSREMIMKLAAEHDCVLTIEGGRPGDFIVVSRGGNGVLDVEVKGVSAHGSTPELGVNAAEEMAHLVQALKGLEDRTKNTFITTRIIESGTANRANTVVPDRATALVRVGTFSREELTRVLKQVEEIKQQPSIPGATINIEFKLGAYAFPRTPQNEQMAQLAQAIYSGLGLDLGLKEERSSADSNFAAVNNKAVLDGLSVIGGDGHSEKEWADVNSLLPRLYLVSRFLIELGALKLA
jgi:glutamate carboxypeptidase